ncbi:MAG: hypothetical protein ABIR47_04640 [Candidatus Kapaibacterium sp.]
MNQHLPWLRLHAAWILALLAISVCARAQDADTTWDDLGLDPKGFTFDDETIGHVSRGWFPQAYAGYTLMYSGPFGDTFDAATDIRPRAFSPTTAPFSWHNPYEGDERKIYQPNKDEEEDDGYPSTSYDDYSLQFLYNLPMPAVIRLGAGLQVTEGMLFSLDNSRHYLSLGGSRQPLKEVGVAYLKQYSLAGTVGLDIPIYGAFIKTEALSLSSYYYLFGGYSFAYAISSKGTQYEQIANAKQAIRYGNGSDTATLIDKRTFDGLQRLRRSIDVGIGWNVMGVDFLALSMEGFVSIPQTSLLDDSDWKQYFVGLRISLGIHWLPKKSK